MRSLLFLLKKEVHNGILHKSMYLSEILGRKKCLRNKAMQHFKTFCRKILFQKKNIYRKTPVPESHHQNETLAGVISCEFCQTFLNSFFKQHGSYF